MSRIVFKIVAQNRFGHQTVYAADGILDLCAVVCRAVWIYQWLNVSVTRIR